MTTCCDGADAAADDDDDDGDLMYVSAMMCLPWCCTARR